jgi:hypothetical protein
MKFYKTVAKHTYIRKINMDPDHKKTNNLSRINSDGISKKCSKV